MEPIPFYRQLVALSLATALGLSALTLDWSPLADQRWFSLGCVVFYAVLTVAIYLTARKAAAHPKPTRLAQYVMVLTFAKMFFSLLLVYSYYLIQAPTGQAFLLPFFASYFVFTVFETYVLLTLNRSRGK